jgi:hypothetical protein
MSEPIAGASGTASDGRFDRPIVIISPPRSGSTLLFETLEKAPGLFSIGSESHGIIESIPGFHPVQRNWHSNQLSAEDAKTSGAQTLRDAFYGKLRDRDGTPATGPVRMIEKTPKNSLRIPFLDALWPTSTFIYLYRDVRQTLASMMEAWASGHFRTYPRLPGWTGYPWSLLLVPGWQELRGQPLPEVVAHQWSIATRIMLDDLAVLPRERIRVIRHSEVVADAANIIPALARSVDLEWDRPLRTDLPLSKTTVSQPRPDKWRRVEHLITPLLPIVAEADERARQFVADMAAR